MAILKIIELVTAHTPAGHLQSDGAGTGFRNGQ